MAVLNVGARRLRELVARSDGEWTQVKLAKAAGVSQAAVSRFLNGKAVPGRRAALALAQFGIAPSDWDKVDTAGPGASEASS